MLRIDRRPAVVKVQLAMCAQKARRDGYPPRGRGPRRLAGERRVPILRSSRAAWSGCDSYQGGKVARYAPFSASGRRRSLIRHCLPYGDELNGHSNVRPRPHRSTGGAGHADRQFRRRVGRAGADDRPHLRQCGRRAVFVREHYNPAPTRLRRRWPAFACIRCGPRSAGAVGQLMDGRSRSASRHHRGKPSGLSQ
jgi:hypothetical protein